MKILQVIPYFNPKKGGDVSVVYNLSKYLIQRGHDITILTSDIEFDREYASSLEKVNIISFNSIINISNFIYTPDINNWLKKELHGFDLVHLHNFRSFQNIVVYHHAKKFGIPYIIQTHGQMPRIIEKQTLKRVYDWVWGGRILKDATKAIALTKTEVGQYKKMGVDENKIVVVPNGIDLSEYENLPERGEFRRKYKVKDNEKIILCLGRIHRIKGLNLIVKAFANLINESVEVKLIIVGPDAGFLKRLKIQIEEFNITDKILFTGPLYGADKLEAYVDVDVYVLPSIYDAFPVTVLEVMASGIPIITTDRCLIAELVDGNVGYVVGYDENELKDAIFKILSDEKLRRRFGEMGKRLVNEGFGWDEIVRKVEEVYEKTYKQ